MTLLQEAEDNVQSKAQHTTGRLTGSAKGSLTGSSRGYNMVALVLLSFDGKTVRLQHECLASLPTQPYYGEQESKVSMSTSLSLTINRATMPLPAVYV